MRMPHFLRRWLTEGDDAALRLQTPKLTQPGPYDERKASAGYRRSRSQTETGRKYRAATGEPEPLRRVR